MLYGHFFFLFFNYWAWSVNAPLGPAKSIFTLCKLFSSLKLSVDQRTSSPALYVFTAFCVLAPRIFIKKSNNTSAEILPGTFAKRMTNNRVNKEKRKFHSMCLK